MTTSAEWIRRTYGVPAQKHRRIAYTGNPEKGRQLGTIVGFSGPHLRIRLDGVRGVIGSHPTWEIEYLDELANEKTCEQCDRTGTRGFRTLPATEHTKPITLCANKAACRKRWPKPTEDAA